MWTSATVNDVITIDYNHQSQQPDSKALNVEIFCFSVNHGSTRKLFLIIRQLFVYDAVW